MAGSHLKPQTAIQSLKNAFQKIKIQPADIFLDKST